MKNILYIFMRNDLPSLNSGKAMAQASHASSQFIRLFRPENNEIVRRWCDEGKGFGTTIVLEGDKYSIDMILQECKGKTYCECQGDVIDETYPFKGQYEILRLLIQDAEYHNIKYNDDAKPDENGMIDCTRSEHTCSWMFFFGDDNAKDNFRRLCEQYNVHLHR